MKLPLFAAGVLLFSSLAYAQPYKGSVTYKNGQVKEGFIADEPAYNDTKIKFKGENGKFEKIKTEDLALISYATDAGVPKKFVTVAATDITFYVKGKPFYSPRAKGFYWLKVEKEGEKLWLIAFSYDYSTMMFMAGDKNPDMAARNLYFLQQPKVGGAEYIYDTYINDGDKVDNVSRFKETASLLFNDEWKAFVETLNEKNLNGKSLKDVVKTYDSFSPDDNKGGLNLKRL